MLIINADDLGRTKLITDRILSCYSQERINSCSAMVFMKDSERAAELVRKFNLSVGLHLNFTSDFTGNNIHRKLREQHRSIATYLNARKLNQFSYNPLLRKAFNDVFQAQWDEFCRLYENEPVRVDGHHHMHLCMNMLLSNKLPKGINLRRNFTFRAGEKDTVNRLYRYLVDCYLKRHFQCTDYFYSMAPIEQKKLQRLVLLSKYSDLELMVHPGVSEEYEYLLSPEWEDFKEKSQGPLF